MQSLLGRRFGGFRMWHVLCNRAAIVAMNAALRDFDDEQGIGENCAGGGSARGPAGQPGEPQLADHGTAPATRGGRRAGRRRSFGPLRLPDGRWPDFLLRRRLPDAPDPERPVAGPPALSLSEPLADSADHAGQACSGRRSRAGGRRGDGPGADRGRGDRGGGGQVHVGLLSPRRGPGRRDDVPPAPADRHGARQELPVQRRHDAGPGGARARARRQGGSGRTRSKRLASPRRLGWPRGQPR